MADRSYAQWLNPAAFQRPADGTYGTMPLDAIRGVTRWNIDSGLSRSFGLRGARLKPGTTRRARLKPGATQKVRPKPGATGVRRALRRRRLDTVDDVLGAVEPHLRS